MVASKVEHDFATLSDDVAMIGEIRWPNGDRMTRILLPLSKSEDVIDYPENWVIG